MNVPISAANPRGAHADCHHESARLQMDVCAPRIQRFHKHPHRRQAAGNAESGVCQKDDVANGDMQGFARVCDMKVELMPRGGTPNRFQSFR